MTCITSYSRFRYTHSPNIIHQLPGATVGDVFFDPMQVTSLLYRTGWEEVQIDAVTEPAWIGPDVADVMSYVQGMLMIRSLTAGLRDEALTERVLATIADQYAVAFKSTDGGVGPRRPHELVPAHRP